MSNVQQKATEIKYDTSYFESSTNKSRADLRAYRDGQTRAVYKLSFCSFLLTMTVWSWLGLYSKLI